MTFENAENEISSISESHHGERIWRRLDDHEGRIRDQERRTILLEEKFKALLNTVDEMRHDMRAVNALLQTNGAKLESLILINESSHGKIINEVRSMTQVPVNFAKAVVLLGAAAGVLFGASKLVVKIAGHG